MVEADLNARSGLAPTAVLPDGVRRVVERVLGRVGAVERLGGLSGSSVCRVRTTGGRAILKGGVKAAEAEFYQDVAPLLARLGIAVPTRYWAGGLDGRWWLLLEDVPQPLPRERWGADPEVLRVLARLHAAAGLPRLRAADVFHPGWTEGTNAAAMGAFAPGDAAELRSTLEVLRGASGHLFEPVAPLSGDANPYNWGLRDDGTLVLFDWERFCRAHPALDLATPLPGLGTFEEYAETAERYLRLRTDAALPWSAAELTRDIGLAKAWIMVEFVAQVVRDRVVDGPGVAWLRAAVPDWMQTVGRELVRRVAP